PALLHPVGRAADVEVDLVVAEIGRDAGASRERARVRAAELERHRMLGGIEADGAGAGAGRHRAGPHPLRIDARAAREQAMKEPAMAVGPVHHRRNTEPMSLIWLHFYRSIKMLVRLVCTRFYAMTRHFSPQFDTSVHTERTRRGDLYQAQIWF